MHFPLPPHRNMRVKYVDNTSLEDNLERFPELRKLKLVRPDYVEDGFSLPSLPSSSQDFVIANHVLEHAPNPLRVLSRWADVLRPGGVIFLAVPIAERCFDRGRTPTSVEHFAEDFRSAPEVLSQRNLEHYMEWLNISEPAILAESGKAPTHESAEVRRARAEQMRSDDIEIHFHAFSVASFHDLLNYFADQVNQQFAVKTVVEAGGEVIGILARRS